MPENIIQNNVEYEKILNVETKITELKEALFNFGTYNSTLLTELEELEKDLFQIREIYDKKRLKDLTSKKH